MMGTSREMPAVLSNSLLAASCLASYGAFRCASRCVEATQTRRLLDILRRARDTRFGREHGFAAIDDVEAFREEVPLADYSAYAGYVAAIAAGEPNVLTGDPVRFLQPSSGSTAAAKLVPLTDSLRREFMRGVLPWLANLFLRRKELVMGRAYWAVTPGATPKTATPGGTPLGFDEDSAYFGPAQRWLLRGLLAVPDAVAAIADVSAFQYVTLLFLLAERNLRLISVWNPTFLTLLVRRIPAWADRLIDDVGKGAIRWPGAIDPCLRESLARRLSGSRAPSAGRSRAEQLRRVLSEWSGRGGDGEAGLGSALWPHLRLVSCWADGQAAACIPELERLFPGVEIQPKGLLATEGIVSLPWIGEEGCPLAVRSHFFEFVDQDCFGAAVAADRPTKLSHELEEGREYSVVLTTGGGLYRYLLRDIVRVVGFWGRLPLLRFVAKEDQVSDVAGEKLHAAHVEQVLAHVWERHGQTPAFCLLAPERTAGDGCGYVLLVSAELDHSTLRGIGGEVDEGLRRNFHYDYCRKLGQLSPVRVYALEDGEAACHEKYLLHAAGQGGKLGTVKPTALESRLGWSRVFRGRFL
jgi:hypothetical protein